MGDRAQTTDVALSLYFSYLCVLSLRPVGVRGHPRWDRTKRLAAVNVQQLSFPRPHAAVVVLRRSRQEPVFQLSCSAFVAVVAIAAKQYHPDVLSGSESDKAVDERFVRIAEAYTVLSNPTLRGDYDQKRYDVIDRIRRRNEVRWRVSVLESLVAWHGTVIDLVLCVQGNASSISATQPPRRSNAEAEHAGAAVSRMQWSVKGRDGERM